MVGREYSRCHFFQLPSWFAGLDFPCPVSGAGPKHQYHLKQVSLECGQGWGRQERAGTRASGEEFGHSAASQTLSHTGQIQKQDWKRKHW